MKKLLSFLLVTALLLPLAACTTPSGGPEETTPPATEPSLRGNVTDLPEENGWTLDGEGYHLTTTEDDVIALSSTEIPEGESFSYEATVRLDTEGARVGILFGASGSGSTSHNALMLDLKYSKRVKVYEKYRRALWEMNNPLTLYDQSSNTYHLRVEVTKEGIATFFINHRELGQKDLEHNRSGKIGFIGGAGTVTVLDAYLKIGDTPTLTNLTADKATLAAAFESDSNVYTAEVPYAADSISLSADFDSKTAVAIGDIALQSGTLSAPIALSVGMNLLEITATDTVSGVTNTYTVAVNRSPVMTEADVEKQTATFLYVSPTGDDSAAGTVDAPLKTVAAAIAAARAIDGTTVINLRAGEYFVTEPIALTAEDENLVIRAYGEEEVSIRASYDIPLSAFEKVTDPAILSRVIEASGRENLLHVKLADLGITDFGALVNTGMMLEYGTLKQGAILSYNDSYLPLAQYPNGTDDFLRTGEIVRQTNGPVVQGNLAEAALKLQDGGRYQYYTEAEDPWLFGFPFADWADMLCSTTVDADGTVHFLYRLGYAVASEMRMKYMNLLEEIDVPGEYFLNYETGDLYLYAPEGMGADECFTFTSYADSLLKADGARNITFENIRFAGSRGERMIDIKNSDAVVFDHCEITNAGFAAVYFTACYNSGVKNSYIHDIGGIGVYIDSCGDKEKLISGNCFVVNCELRTFSRYKTMYTPAVRTNYDVGTYIAFNEIHDAPHSAILFTPIEATVEFNNIYDVCKSTRDAGAIYAGATYHTQGNVIRYNYIHDLVAIEADTPHGVEAIYLDDMFSSCDIYSNVIVNTHRTSLIGGGRYNTFRRNVVLDCGRFEIDARAADWANPAAALDRTFDWKSEIWAEKYPLLAVIEEDEIGVPKYNSVLSNYLHNGKLTINGTVTENGIVLKNVLNTGDATTVDAFFSEVYPTITEQIFDFMPIPFDSIGTYDQPYIDMWVEG